MNETPLRKAHTLLGLKRRELMAKLTQLGGIYRDATGHLHPTRRWAQLGWIVEREGWYQHPVLGQRCHNTLYITPHGLHHLLHIEALKAPPHSTTTTRNAS